MRVTAARSIVAAALALVALLLCGHAAAGPKVISVELRADTAGLPTHVCIVTQRVPNLDGVLELDALPGAKDWTERRFTLAEIADRMPALAGVKEDLERFHERGAGCVGDVAGCEPAFSLKRERPTPAAPQQRFIACKANTQPGAGRRAQVAVLEIRAYRNDAGEEAIELPEVSKLSVPGGKVTFEVSEAKRAAIVSANVVGGHYAPAPGRDVAEAREVRLEPLCQTHEIVVPPATGIREIGVAFDGGAGEPSECTEHLGASRRFKMSLPFSASRTLKTLKVTTGDRRRGTFARYEGTWTDERAPAVVTLRSTAVSFTWQRDCLYPDVGGALVCPIAQIADAGLPCSPGVPHRGRDVPDTCTYVCDPGAPRERSREANAQTPAPTVPFDLPTRVLFRRPGSDETWQIALGYGGQELIGFVAAADRHVDVDLSLWGGAGSIDEIRSRRAARIQWVAIRGPTGDEHYVAPALHQRVSLPGVRCGDQLGYRPVGEREYGETHVKVEGGRIRLERPEQQEELLITGLSVGVGGVFPIVSARSGSERFDLPIEPVVVARGALGVRPPGRALALELRGSFMFGPRRYFPIADPSSTTRAHEDVPDARFGIDPVVWWTFASQIHVGAGVGAGGGAPPPAAAPPPAGGPRGGAGPAGVGR